VASNVCRQCAQLVTVERWEAAGEGMPRAAPARHVAILARACVGARAGAAIEISLVLAKSHDLTTGRVAPREGRLPPPPAELERRLALVVGRVQEEYVDCDVEVEVVIAHEGGHAPTRQLLQHWHEFSAKRGV
jgi:hypothetical protein